MGADVRPDRFEISEIWAVWFCATLNRANDCRILMTLLRGKEDNEICP